MLFFLRNYIRVQDQTLNYFLYLSDVRENIVKELNSDMDCFYFRFLIFKNQKYYKLYQCCERFYEVIKSLEILAIEVLHIFLLIQKCKQG